MKKLALVMLLSPLAMPAFADMFSGVGMMDVKPNVYGSLSVTQSDSDIVNPVDNLKLQYGIDKQASVKDSSVIGVRVPVQYGNLSMTVDASAKQRADRTFKPEFREASIGMKAPVGYENSMGVNVGVMPLEIFKYSKYQDQRMNLLTTGVTTDIYAQVPFQQYVGGEVYFNSRAYDIPMTVKVFGGKAKTQFALDTDYLSDLYLNKMIGANVTAKAGAFTLWGSYVNGRLEMKDELYRDVIDVMNMYEPLYPGVSDLAHRVSWNNVSMVFGSVGVSYAQNNVIVDAELAKTDAYAWNLTAGYKLGKVTPFIAYSGIMTHDAVPSNPVDAVNDPALYQVSQDFYDQTQVKQHTESVGVKYQATPRVAYKLQVNHTKLNDGFGVVKVKGFEERDVLSGTASVDFSF